MSDWAKIDISVTGSREYRASHLRAEADRIDGGETWRGYLSGRRFWAGFLAGVMFIAIMDLGDFHICVGECDGAGYDIAGPRK